MSGSEPYAAAAAAAYAAAAAAAGFRLLGSNPLPFCYKYTQEKKIHKIFGYTKEVTKQ
jgi:hypothetical protein